MRLLLPLLLLLSACSPCHTKHEHVRYIPRHEECDTIDIEIGDSSYPITSCSWVEAACRSEWWCDVRCPDIDKGKSEAHQKHQTLVTPTTFDYQCQSGPTTSH